jgi:hypothetical protein
MKIFLSYSHLDKRLAGKIKKYLLQYGVKVFLAHDDIEPSEEWADKILEELRDCHVFMPILTKHFNKSNWTDQETGCALILNKGVMLGVESLFLTLPSEYHPKKVGPINSKVIGNI